MVKANIGLTFSGTCESAFEFYKNVFGGEYTDFIRFREDPATDAATPEKDKNKIAYAALPVGGIVLYGDDTLESSGMDVIPGNNMSISYEPDSKKDADRIFQALSQGSKILAEMTDFPWGYYGSLIDKFGVKWVVWYKNGNKEIS